MSGRQTAEYHRAYRAANRERLNAATRARRANGRVRGDRSSEYSRRAARRAASRPAPLGVLYPELQHGARVAFWDDELRMDLAQEAALARLEGRDPDAAVAAYQARETNWRHHTAPLQEEAA